MPPQARDRGQVATLPAIRAQARLGIGPGVAWSGAHDDGHDGSSFGLQVRQMGSADTERCSDWWATKSRHQHRAVGTGGWDGSLAGARTRGGTPLLDALDRLDLLVRPRRRPRCPRCPRGGVPPEGTLFARRCRIGRSVGFADALDAFDPFVITDLLDALGRLRPLRAGTTSSGPSKPALRDDDAGALLGRPLGRAAVALGLHVRRAGRRGGLAALGPQVGDEDLGRGARRLVVLLGEDVVDRER